ncbi:hypothetical protein AX16_002998 [Volvariella volvacea WC 439]|nr:hypothetical protein AX16_002998 [Volvariella volvacea WC 439]
MSDTYTLPKRSTLFPSKTFNDASLLKRVNAIWVFGTPTADDALFHFRLLLIGNDAAKGGGAGEDQDAEAFKPGRTDVGAAAVAAGSAVRLDMRPSYTDMRNLMNGVVFMEDLPVGVGLERWIDGDGDVPVFERTVRRGDLTVGDVCRVLFEENALDRYRFNEDGNGCRHWCANVLRVLQELGWIGGGSVEAFEAWEEAQGSALGSRFPMPRLQGTFY